MTGHFIILTCVPVISLLAFLHLSVSFNRLPERMYAVFSSAWRSRVDAGPELWAPQVTVARSGHRGRRDGWQKTRHSLPGGWVVLFECLHCLQSYRVRTWSSEPSSCDGSFCSLDVDLTHQLGWLLPFHIHSLDDLKFFSMFYRVSHAGEYYCCSIMLLVLISFGNPSSLVAPVPLMH